MITQMSSRYTTKDNEYMLLMVHISNNSNTKKTEFHTWRGMRGGLASLSDEYDNNYLQIDFGFSASWDEFPSHVSLYR